MNILWLLVILFTLFQRIAGYTAFSDEKIRATSNITAPANSIEKFLDSFLVPRVPGTESHAKVQRFIITHFEKLGWHVEQDNFTDTTPLGKKPFSNIIVTKDITASKRLVLAAHYDSKYFEPPNHNFVGATDSAFSCALLLDLAFNLDKLLNRRSNLETTLQIIFFDGEEAFQEWTATDSLYGSRHLATKWEQTYVTRTDYFQHHATSLLDGIEVFVLLDLLGAKDPQIKNFFQTTSWLYKNLARIENRLWEQSLLRGDENDLEKELYFDPKMLYAFYQYGVEDDHLPFLQKGVPIVHIIPYPFPSVWHKLEDNKDALDPEVMHNLNLIFRVFAAEYLHLDP
ncbi:hypothetical protein G9A89_022980 [Geosiphon pyriformis]|nr:hypothetical protein G9A89_022980 [Geosiphon pyriformis]